MSAPLGDPPRTSVEVILRSYAITSQELTRVKLARAKERLGERLLYVRPQVEGIGVLEFERLFQAKEAGWRAAQQLIPKLVQLLPPGGSPT